jgi:hypothetical protein
VVEGEKARNTETDMKLTFIYGIGLAILTSGTSGCVLRFAQDDGEEHEPDPRWPIGPAPEDNSVDGIPCEYLAGEVTLSDYDGANYGASAFNFELNSQDPNWTLNEFNLLYDDGAFRVKLVTDDISHIVDLGALLLTEVPPTVVPDDYPVGRFGDHDFVAAVLNHTYFVRSEDSRGRHVAAFSVAGMEPGRRITIQWIRSADPDVMRVPVECIL